ncbi:MAG: hypothetical protein ACK5ME_07575 [Parahaliea sp.]
MTLSARLPASKLLLLLFPLLLAACSQTARVKGVHVGATPVENARIESNYVENTAQMTGSVQAQAGLSEQRSAPELNLNLDAPRVGCDCKTEGDNGPSFLERGYTALASGDYIEAVQQFQRYQRTELTPEADWEAGVALAYISLLPDSPFYDNDAAHRSVSELDKLRRTDMNVHKSSLILWRNMGVLIARNRQINEMEAVNSSLRDDLGKREEALKRLRELTLGQRGGRP